MATSMLAALGSVNQSDRHTPTISDRRTPTLADRRSPTDRHSPDRPPTAGILTESQSQPFLKIISQDMSRRKQRNPKSLGGSSADESVKQEPEEADDEPRDVSNLVKVEIDQQDDDPNTTNESIELPATSPRVPLLPSVEDVMRKWNMLQFGEVSVPNHPNIPIVPMALQMVYLYPMSRAPDTGEVRYKMLVPMNAAMSSPPLFSTAAAAAAHSPPPMHLNLAQFHGSAAPPASASAAEPGTSKVRGGGSDDDIKQSPPLDLTNKSPEHKEDDISSKKAGPQFGLESHFNLLKMKEMELLKTPPINRCNECNINFSKYQNYLAHKKYYCSGVKQAQAADSDDVTENKQQPQAPKCKSPRSSSTSPSEHLNREQLGKELLARELLMKQQEALLAGMKGPPLPLLLPNPRLPNPLQAASHFGCEGCGISFKSISNLQAHQSRYCAGIKKSDEMKFLEALMKSGGAGPSSAAAAAAAGVAHSSPAGQTSPTSAAAASMSPALSEMLALLSARKQDIDAEKEKGRAGGSSGAAAGDKPESSENKSEDSGSEEVFCKICGLKESREKLIDHIYVHLIGQVKKRKLEDESPESEAGEEKRVKVEDDLQQQRNGAEPQQRPRDGIKCEHCGIVFSKHAAYSAHVEFYCQKKVKKE